MEFILKVCGGNKNLEPFMHSKFWNEMMRIFFTIDTAIDPAIVDVTNLQYRQDNTLYICIDSKLHKEDFPMKEFITLIASILRVDASCISIYKGDIENV